MTYQELVIKIEKRLEAGIISLSDRRDAEHIFEDWVAIGSKELDGHNSGALETAANNLRRAIVDWDNEHWRKGHKTVMPRWDRV